MSMDKVLINSGVIVRNLIEWNRKRGGKEDSESFILIVTSKFSFDGSDICTDKHPKGFDL